MYVKCVNKVDWKAKNFNDDLNILAALNPTFKNLGQMCSASPSFVGVRQREIELTAWDRL